MIAWALILAMFLSSDAASLLREMAKRRAIPTEQKTAVAREAAESLRSFLYPKQRAFFAPGPTKWRATRKARRAGITTGGCRELIARATDQSGFRAMYMATTRDEAIARAWRSDTQSGLVDVLSQAGTKVKHPTLTCYGFGGLTIEVREQDLELNFSNGSQIKLFGADKIKQYDRKRGGAKHVFWIDEAQSVPAMDVLFDSVVIPSLSDYVGECWMTGTPGRDCVGMFYDITKEPSDDEPPLENWDVHELYSTDNPFFGRVVEVLTAPSTVSYYVQDNTGARHGPYEDAELAAKAAHDVRWDRTAGAAKIAKNWKGDEPDFMREWLGKWVKSDARFVYPVHGVPVHQLLYAPQRLAPNPFVGTHKRFEGHPPWFDFHAAFLDLPRAPRGHRAHQWMFAIGADFGYNPDPFALVMWAFCYDLQDIYEMHSWKQIRVHTDDQGQYMKLLWDAAPNIVSFVGDPAGKRDDFEMWQRRMGLPIEEANKQGKNTLEEFLADDIRRGRVHLREKSPLYTEMRYLVYLPGKPGKPREVDKHRKVNGIAHGDHCCFIAGTDVETSDGPRPIETVDVGDWVHTRAGLRPVTAAFSAGTREVWRLETEDGRVLVGTGDHPIWNHSGWTRLDELMPGATLTSWGSTASPRLSRSTADDIDATPMHRIGHRASTSRELSRLQGAAIPRRCIEQSGNSTTGQFPTATTSTIETTIHSTTTSPISNSSMGLLTSASTVSHQSESRCRERTSDRPGSLRPNGMDRRPDSHGTPSTASGPWRSASPSRSSAYSAATAFEARTATPRPVATHVGPLSDETAASMMRRVSARNASVSSSSTSTRAGSAALTRVLRVERIALALPVFNLTVADAHEYFANGILVHNCDGGRYSYNDLQHYLSQRKPDKPDPGTPEAYAAEEEKEQRAIEDADLRRARAMAEGDEMAAEQVGSYEW